MGRGAWEVKKNLSEKILISDPDRPMLHAEALGFVHPDKGAYCEFTAPIPHDMAVLVETLQTHHLKQKEDEKA